MSEPYPGGAREMSGPLTNASAGRLPRRVVTCRRDRQNRRSDVDGAQASPAMTAIRLRRWQRTAFDRFTALDGDADDARRDFLAVATPGAGKTTFALTCARWALAAE